jgi:maleylacetoacetate isomerase
MKLYDYFRSSAAFRVRIALNLKGLAPERSFVHLRKGDQHADEYLALNPQGLVPSLVTDAGEVLTQSLAILEWLDETYPHPPLLPADAGGRARVRAIALAIACDIHPIDNLRVLQYLERELGVDEAKRNDWYRHWIERGFEAIERLLAGRSPGRFCFGDSPTLADVCLVPQVANSQRLKMPLDRYPRIQAINEACLAVPAFDAARPENQPDAEK